MEKKKRKLMAWVEVYGGQRNLAFELTTERRLRFDHDFGY